MPDLLMSTPLIALKAAALDAEATGLDVRKARLIEIGVVPVEQGRLVDAAAYAALVACGEPIPAAASAVHGIHDADLAGKPTFPQVHGAIADALAGRVVIGHTIGFDLALMARECERAGLAPFRPLALDVRVLAQLVARDMPSYALEGLAAWLGVSGGDRHRALGDAALAGRIFLALLPKLRETGVRTLGEALARSKMVTDALAGQMPAEWELQGRAASDEAGISRLDSYPYSHRVRDVMTSPPFRLDPATRLRDALGELARRRYSSALVAADLSDASAAGIITERDIMRALADGGAAALERPSAELASRPLLTVPDDALIYRAIGRMANRNLRHLAAVGADDSIVGMVSARDLLRLRASAAIALGDDIDSAADVPALAAAWAKLPGMAAALRREGVTARQIAAVIAREVGALTRRAAQIAEAELAAGPAGPAPCGYAVLVLGSAGRGESLLAMDQDNAVIFAEGEPGGAEDLWFAAHGERMCAILHEVGVPLCKGGVMASKPAFRGSAAEWRRRIARWLSRADPADLLAVDIFFDFRAVHGRRALAQALWEEAWAAARGDIAFLKQLAGSAGEGGGHVSMFGRLRGDDDGRIDIKGAVLKGVVTAARVLALRHGVTRHATAERLSGLIAAGVGGRADLEGLDADHQTALDLILDQQLADIGEGRAPGNRAAVKMLSALDAERLKAALGRQKMVNELVRETLTG